MYNNTYMLGDNQFFTQPTIMKPDQKITNLVSKIIPQTWVTNHHKVWLSGTPKNQILPEQGFKIHVSAIDSNIYQVIEATVTQCVKFNTAFKVICRKDIANQMASKATGRGSSGKVITIYPCSITIFKSLIHQIHLNTKDFKGPYILSDKRYKESNIVHYRYGGFRLIPKIHSDGSQTACIKTPSGSLVEDERAATYALPEWIEEPFPSLKSDTGDIEPLNGRYEIYEAFSFSNSGGVYKAKDLKTGKNVVVKEARPYVHFCSVGKSAMYADQVLENEFNVVKVLSDSPHFPAVIDWFVEWEHSFFVEEFIEGIPLRNYRGKKEVTIVPFVNNLASAVRFQKQFAWIAKEAILAVQSAHKKRVILGDISPNNILVDEKNRTIRFIDFEGAYIADQKSSDKNRALLTTPGFSDNDFFDVGATYKGDWFALAMALYSMIFPALHIFSLAPKKRWDLLEKLEKDCSLLPQVAMIIKSLSEAKPREALELVAQLSKINSVKHSNKQAEFIKKLPCYKEANKLTNKKLDQQVKEITKFIEQGVKTKIDPNFMPIDYSAYDVHPLALTYGYYGPAVLMAKTGQKVPEHILKKINQYQDQPTTAGLFVGYAGMALAELEIGRTKQAREWAKKSYDTIFKYEDCSFAHGLAGVGYLHLKMFSELLENNYLNQAIIIAEALSDKAYLTKNGCKFNYPNGDKDQVGMAYGNTGISLFLLNLSKLTKNKKYLQLAIEIFEHDLNVGRKEDNQFKWGKTEGSSQVLPYWEHGASGIGAVAIRFYEYTGDVKYKKIAESIALSSYTRYSVDQGQFIGVAGIAEFFIDMYQITGKSQYKNMACEISDRISFFSIKKGEGVLYPSRSSVRLSTDYAFGSSGIGMMFNRLENGGKRFMHDL